MSMPKIYTAPEQSKEARELIADLGVLEEKLGAVPDTVESEKDAEIVSEYRAQFNKRKKELDKQRLEMTAGARQTITMVNDQFRLIIERADRAIQLCDNLLTPYLAEQRRIREEAERAERERKAEEERARQEAARAIEQAQRIAEESTDKAALVEAEKDVAEARAELDEISRQPAKKKVAKSVTGSLGSKTGLRKIWKYRVVDIDKVPEEYLLPPEDRVKKGELNKIAKKDQETAYVPGIEFYYEDSISSAAK